MLRLVRPTLPAWLASVLLIYCGLARARADQVIDMAAGAQAEILFIEHLESSPPTGWMPVGFRIINHASNAREWTVRFECDLGTGTNLLGEWILPVAGGETREVNLLVPQPWFVNPHAYFQVRGTISGPGVVNGGIYIDRSFSGGNQTPFTGMSQTLAAENWSRLEAELDPASVGGGTATTTSHDLIGSRFDPAQVPADWRAWSGFVTIWLHRDDWIALSNVQRLAFTRWIAQGGELYIAGPSAALADLPGLEVERSLAGEPWERGALGFGRVTRVPLAVDDPETGAARLPISAVAEIVRRSAEPTPALGRLDNDIDTTEAETALGKIKPGGFLLGLLIATIAILLGPVNIFLLAPARRRARLFITVPVISIGGALALVILILFQDGTGGRGQRGVLIALQPDRPEALVLQEQCAMTGLLIGRDFMLPEDATIIDYTDNPGNSSYYPGVNRPARGGLHRVGPRLSGDWFTSRTVHAQHIRTFVPTRAALTLTSTDDATMSVVSTCPGVLRDVILTDAQQRTWWAAEVPPGRTVNLQPAGPLVTGRWHEQLQRFGVSLAAATTREEPPLSFHASADAWDEHVPVPTLPSISWGANTILVTGPVKEAKP